MLEVKQLVKRFGALAATDGASFDVRPGELHALIGPNGAGKTTLIHQISGALQPDAGAIVFNGQDVTRQGMARRVQAGLVRSFQITSLFKPCTVRDNLVLAVLARREGAPSWWRSARADAAAHEQAESLLARVGLAGQAHRIAGELAHGEQRQLEVGLALAARPRLLLLDEPLAGMGPDESARMVELLQALKDEGLTLLLVEHDMDAVFRLADRISTLVCGRVIASDSPAAIREHPEVRRAYLGDELEAAR
ncbi:branched-chain amino acid transport system ATP-binding protein [Pelomonas aquatica]|uniref:Branched-chain amino acid transport system ATP-binding protein n=1 Tax=Pelomonas aquatica TaxID=431058 RepID=A0ABU1ZH99_9BURK|nr:ABC transporter ATP-binding protein [Pelomonas aquatica]MDR7299046.1 branched-chain amino acid transport system ATP-binding protein [Pelomonas aquatica]